MTVEPMTDAEVDRLRLTANAKWIDRGGMWMRPIDVLDLIARIDAAEAERDAAVARAMPAPRLMRTVEGVEALADGPILFRWSAAVVANSGTRVAVKSGRLILLDGYSQQLSWLTQAYVVALPDLPTPTAAQEATDAE